MKKLLLIPCLCLLGITIDLSAATLAYWNFSNLSNFDSAVDNTATSDAALSIVGNSFNTNDSRTYATDTEGIFNLGTSESFVFQSSNGAGWEQWVVSFNTTNFQEIAVGFDVVRRLSGATHGGADAVSVEYQVGGGGFNAFGSSQAITYTSTSGRFDNGVEESPTRISFDFSSITALDNTANVDVRFTFDTTNIFGTDRTSIDNLEVTAVAIPEPSSFMMIGVGAGLLFWLRRRSVKKI
ncbi:MAG: PEP-CTERM sorting domain-containing protein [Verrucomicrobiota bacterium]